MLGTSDLHAVERRTPPDLAAAHRDVVAEFPRILCALEARHFDEALERITALRDALQARVGRAETGDPGTAPTLIALDRLVAFVEDYESALSALVRTHKSPPAPDGAFRFDRDWGAATENGPRSALAILLAGACGIATGWNDWSLLLLILAPYSVLLAMTGNPAAGAVAFITGTILAVPAAFVCAFGLMPGVQGFPLLVAVIAPFWMAGLYATTLPRHAPAGLAYGVAFNTLVGATNPMAFSVPAFLNQAFGWVAAVFVTLFVFRLLLPHDPRRQARDILAAAAAEIAARSIEDPNAWPAAHRVAACLTDMAVLLDAHPDWSFDHHRNAPC